MPDPTETLPPRPDSFASLLLRQNADQHGERMQASRDLQAAISGRFDKLEAGQADVRADVAEIKTRLPGKTMQVAGLTFGSIVLILLILLLATSRGVDTAQAVQGTRQLTTLVTGQQSAPAPGSAPPPSSASSTAADAPQGNGDHSPELP